MTDDLAELFDRDGGDGAETSLGKARAHAPAREGRSELLRAALAALDEAAALGDAQARHAAAGLRARRSSGRQPIDDSHLLREVAALSGCGRDAVGIVWRAGMEVTTRALPQ